MMMFVAISEIVGLISVRRISITIQTHVVVIGIKVGILGV